MTPAVVMLAGYLLGAIPFGYLVARARGIDILKQGSGNIGATNVGRILGRRFGLLVFLLDFAKGAVPVLLARCAPAAWSEGLPADTLPVLAGIATFLGHLFPVYLRFHGGKGVATATGVVAVLAPLPTLAALAVWLATFAGTRMVSLASLAAAVALCGLRLSLTPQPWASEHEVVTFFCLLAATLVFVRHHANIRRLVRGRENRFRETPTMALLARTLHVASVGLAFGTAIFFLIVGAIVFPRFEAIAGKPASERPIWLPVWKGYDGTVDNPRLAQPLRKEQGNRVAGEVVGPLFGPYFAILAGCVVLATLTALAWWSAPSRVHRLRVWVLLLALASIAGGWWMEQYVESLTVRRHETFDAVLQSSPPGQEQIDQAAQARATFAAWHGYSMMLNLVTVVLVTLAMLLAAQLPARASEERPSAKLPETAEAPALTASAK
jgi:acyl-phosphate glycerol 3-phosphate acyltransferase